MVVGEDEIRLGKGEAVDARDLIGETDGIGVEAHGFQMNVHVFPPPAVAFQEVDIGQLYLFEIELKAFGGIGFFGVLVRVGEIVYQELIVPYRVGALEFDGGVFETDVLQLGFVFEEEPVGDVDFDLAGEEKRVVAAVFYKCRIEHHLVKKLEVDMFDPDGGMEVVRKPVGHPGYQPCLDGGYMDEGPYGNQ